MRHLRITSTTHPAAVNTPTLLIGVGIKHPKTERHDVIWYIPTSNTGCCRACHHAPTPAPAVYRRSHISVSYFSSYGVHKAQHKGAWDFFRLNEYLPLQSKMNFRANHSQLWVHTVYQMTFGKCGDKSKQMQWHAARPLHGMCTAMELMRVTADRLFIIDMYWRKCVISMGHRRQSLLDT